MSTLYFFSISFVFLVPPCPLNALWKLFYLKISSMRIWLYLYIYTSDVSYSNIFPQRGSHGRSVSIFSVTPFTHCMIKANTFVSFPPIFIHSVPLLHWFLAFINSPSLLYTLNKLIFIYSHHMTKPPQYTMLYLFNHSTIYSLCCCTHAKFPIHSFFALQNLNLK